MDASAVRPNLPAALAWMLREGVLSARCQRRRNIRSFQEAILTFRRIISTIPSSVPSTIPILALSLLVCAESVRAQDPPAPTQAPIAFEQVEVTDELLERFVDIYPQVLEASQQAQAELATTTDPEQAAAIQARAEETIMTVLDEEMMSPEEYEAVLMALRDDAEKRETFTRMLQEAQADPGA